MVAVLSGDPGAILGNVGTVVAFRLGASDAEVLEGEFKPELSATDLVSPAQLPHLSEADGEWDDLTAVQC